MTVQERSFGTHHGSFHADEVTACALLVLCNLVDRSRIVRTRDPLRLAECAYVCDVGGIYDPSTKRFDHHQSTYTGQLSSAGMVLRYLLEKGYLSPSLYHYFNHSLVLGVDAIDNGKSSPVEGSCSFSAVIANFVPVRYDAKEREFDEAFMQALDFCIGHLSRLQERHTYIAACRDLIREEMGKRRSFLLFEQAMPWMESFFDLGGENHPARFVIMPSGAHWKLRGIPPTHARKMEVRSPLPKEWAGLMGEALQERSGIQGALFCHKGQFISIWETKEDALAALALIEKNTQRGR